MASTSSKTPAAKAPAKKSAKKPATKAGTRVNARGGVARPQAAAAPGPPPVPPPLKKASTFNLAEEIIAIIFVGSEDNMVEFNVHKKVLAEKSPFFAAGLIDGRWLEGQSERPTIFLVESDPAAFSFIVEYMYKDKIGTEEHGDLIKVFLDKKLSQNPELKQWVDDGRPDGDGPKKTLYKAYLAEVQKELTDRATSYIEVWKLADFLGMVPLANYIMRRLISEFDPKKLVNEDVGFNYLTLVPACYTKEVSEKTPIRLWILALFASGLASVRGPGPDTEDYYAEQTLLVQSNNQFLFDISWCREVYEGREAAIRKAKTFLKAIDEDIDNFMFKDPAEKAIEKLSTGTSSMLLSAQ